MKHPGLSELIWTAAEHLTNLRARSDAGIENYARAAQECRVILELQPNHPDAREGLRKIQVAQGRGQ